MHLILKKKKGSHIQKRESEILKGMALKKKKKKDSKRYGSFGEYATNYGDNGNIDLDHGDKND